MSTKRAGKDKKREAIIGKGVYATKLFKLFYKLIKNF